MTSGDVQLLLRVLVGFALAYVIGFERQLRGATAGDRTFALVGVGATAITAVAGATAPQAVAGIVTGIGFIGAGVVVRGRAGLIRGLTTAATIFVAAAIGIVVGYGHLVLGAVSALLVVFVLELQYMPFLRWIDAEHYAARVRSDRAPADETQPRP